MAKVLIAGGTGLVGKRLSVLLKEQGYEVIHLSRRENLEAEFPAYRWDVEKQEIDPRAMAEVDYVINLAGAGIADKPWTERRKELIVESRTQSTALLQSAINALAVKPKAYLAASAIGYYGDRGETLLFEDSGPGTQGFLAESCMVWEEAIRKLSSSELRIVAIRIGVVLANGGGAFPKMKMSLPFRVAPYFGNGQQWFSWIHIDDLCGIFIHALENEEVQGFYNGVAPNPHRNKSLTKEMLKASKYKAMLVPTPNLALRAAMGEMADVVLSGSKVSANKIMAAGYEFQFPELAEAFKDLFAPPEA